MSRPENNKITNIALHPKANLTRRDFFIRSAGTALGLYALAHLESNAPAYAQVAGGNPGISLRGARSTSRRQLPFWGDVANWDKPEYYETMQAGHRRNGRRRGSIYTNANLFGDDRDCLLIRGPKGLLINRFDAATGQWIQDVDGPPLADNMNVYTDSNSHIEYKEWNTAPYYSTLMTADIDNDSNAEILARGVDGLQIFKLSADQQQWNKLPVALPVSDAGWVGEPYYSTLQCANFNGNNVLTGRAADGLYAWQFNSDGSHAQVASLSALSDGNGWGKPECYSTILYADLSGAGSDMLIGRGSDGIHIWDYYQKSPPTENFDDITAQLTGTGPAWTDANGWNLPQYYETIQAAYLGLDRGNASLVGRGKNGIEVWNIDTGQWTQLTFTTPVLTDTQGWDKPEYYSTIQFADIDGDGIEELLARGPQGLQAWKLQDNGDQTYTWVALPNGPDWSDANGWNQVQYYSSIQTATVLQNGDPQYSGSATSNAVVIARNSNNVETWVYNPQTQTWSQTSVTAFPTFTGTQLTAYAHITTALGIRGTGNVGIRFRYNDEASVIQNWIDDLEGRGTITVPPPSGVSAADWEAVKGQVLTELNWVKDAQNWYGTLTHQQIVDTFLGDELTLYTVGPYLSYSTSSDTTTLVLSILGLIAGAAAAALGFPELEAGAAAAIGGIISNTFNAAALGMAGQGSSYTAQYDQLQSQLADAFNLALTTLGKQLSEIVGGGSGTTYVPGDYGLLKAIGQMIDATIWNWPTDTTSLTAAMQRGYAIEVWKVLFNAYQVKSAPSENDWGVWVYNGNPNVIDQGYPTYAAWFGYEPWYPNHPGGMQHWLFGPLSGGYRPMPPIASLQAQFDTPVDGQVFPLGVPTSEFYQAQNGWPKLGKMNRGDSATPPEPIMPKPISAPKLPSLGVEIDSATLVTRDPDTNEIVVAVTTTNRGLTGAPNVVVADITLGNQKPVISPPARHKYIGAGKHYTQTFRFAPQGAGSRAVLRMAGRYLGGSFGTSMRVVIP
jgi:hypothetical protein